MGEDIQLVLRSAAERLPEPTRRRLVLLTGARQTGKTTLARLRYPGLRYVNLDAPESREALRTLPTPRWGLEIGEAVLDEAQKEPVVFEKVKYAFDERSISFTALLGSSQILLLRKVRESLAGRVAVFELFPLMLSEYSAYLSGAEPASPLVDRLLEGQSVASVVSDARSVLLAEEDAPKSAAEAHLLRFGGMPALLHLEEDARPDWLRDYAYTYLERDLGDLARLDDLAPFHTFQRLAALRSARLLSYSELARDSGLSVDTARRYLEYLRLSYQTELIRPYHANLTSRVVKTPKLYWLDIGILRHLTGFVGEVSGELFETYVVAELVKWIRTARRRAEIYFYRTRSGLEVDLLLETTRGIVALEIKASRSPGGRAPRGLRALRDALGDRWRGGLVVYRGDRIEPLETDIWAIPSRRLLS